MAVDFISKRIRRYHGTCQDEEGNNKSSRTEARSGKSQTNISVRNKTGSSQMNKDEQGTPFRYKANCLLFINYYGG